MTTQLSVNVNKLATLRNSRGKNNPDVLKTTLDIIAYGAQGITVHPRPDERHIRRTDVYQIAKNITVEFNIEGYPDPAFLALVKEVKPAQCTLVPDDPQVLTSNAGWQISKHADFLKSVVADLHQENIRTSLFIDPYDLTAKEMEQLKGIGTDRIEFYTEKYADHFGTAEQAQVIAVYAQAAQSLHALGIEINAGHDLNLLNLRTFVQEVPYVKEVSIGHALICDALYFGLEETIQRYLACLQA